MSRTSKSKNTSWYTWESKVASDLNTTPVVGSGNTDFQKGDVVDDHWFIDCKHTDKDSYSIKNSLREKYEQKAALEGREFAMALDINGTKYAVIDYDTFIQIQKVYFESVER